MNNNNYKKKQLFSWCKHKLNSMRFILTTFVFMALTISSLSASNYKLDDNAIDALFDNATVTEVTSLDLVNSNSTININNAVISQGNDQTKVLVAWIVDWVGLGAFGIHRHILGTKGSMWAIYTFTVCGIFGIVPTIDWWVLLIDGLILQNGDKYIDNENFFMWFS